MYELSNSQSSSISNLSSTEGFLEFESACARAFNGSSSFFENQIPSIPLSVRNLCSSFAEPFKDTFLRIQKGSGSQNEATEGYLGYVASMQALGDQMLRVGLSTQNDLSSLELLEKAADKLKDALEKELGRELAKEALNFSKSFSKEIREWALALREYETLENSLAEEVLAHIPHLSQEKPCIGDLRGHLLNTLFSNEYQNPLVSIKEIAHLLVKLDQINIDAFARTPIARERVAYLIRSFKQEAQDAFDAWALDLREDVCRDLSFFKSLYKEKERQEEALTGLSSLNRFALEAQKELLGLPQASAETKLLKKSLDACIKETQFFNANTDPLLYRSLEWEQHHQKIGALKPSFVKKLSQNVCKICSYLNPISYLPERYQPTSKQVISFGFLCLIVGDEGIKMARVIENAHNHHEKINQLRKELENTLSVKVREHIEKEVSLLKDMLRRDVSDQHFEQIERSKFGKVILVIKEIRETQKTFSEEDLSSIGKAYHLYRVAQENQGFFESQISWQSWLRIITLEDKVKASNQKVAEASQEHFQNQTRPEEALERDRELNSSKNLTEAYVQAASLKDKLPVGPLKEYAERLQESLMQTAVLTPSKCSRFEYALWKQKVQDQCYAVKLLEEKIKNQMPFLRKHIEESSTHLAGYGKKHENLIKQAELVEAMGLKGIEVPVPVGLTSSHIHLFLKEFAPEVFEIWHHLKEEYQKNLPALFESRVGLEELNKIDKLIKKAFEIASTNQEAFEKLVSKEMRTWLKNTEENQDYLMVRSTGSEDSKAVVNAGGNTSVSYVRANQKEFSIALGDVVRSYFSVSSLQNRVRAHDDIFSKQVQLSVTAQKLIGESMDGSPEIPVSLVLFSSEPLYVGDEEFRAMRISATLGHGEGVVGNLGVASDTALILTSEAHPDQVYVLYDNIDKPIRLAPQKEGEEMKLVATQNPPSLRHKRVLSHELLMRLYTWGVLGEAFFEGATDMEIVVKNNTIYPVQARPVVRPKSLPSYLDVKAVSNLSQNPLLKTLSSQIVVPAKASLLEIKAREEILLASTLAEAETSYNPNTHKLVIITTQEPANSHPVVNFSTLGVPCLYIEEKEHLSFLDAVSKEQPFAVCLQTGNIYQWDETKAHLKDFVKNGFAMHPANIKDSLLISQEIEATSLPCPKNVRDLALSIQSAQDVDALYKTFWVSQLKEAITTLEKESLKLTTVPKELTQILDILKKLDEKVERAFDELKALVSEPNKENHLQKLLYQKILLSVLSSSKKGLKSYALSEVSSLEKQARRIIEAQKPFDTPLKLVSELSFADSANDLEIEEKWSLLLQEGERAFQTHETSLQEIKAVKDLLKFIKESHSELNWLTFFMPTSWKELVQEAFSVKESSEKLKEVTQRNKEALIAEQNLQAFGSLKEIDLALKNLEALRPSIDQLNALKKTDHPLYVMGMFAYLKRVTQFYDLAIKTMKMSSEFDENAKIERFRSMNRSFLNFLKEVFESNMKETFGASIISNENQSFKLYFVHSQLDKILPTPNSLFPSPEFSVAAAKIGSPTTNGPERHPPQTFEDLFTFTHQSLLSCLSNFEKHFYNNTFQNALLPDSFKKILNSVPTSKKENPLYLETELLGIEIGPFEIKVSYNVPLRWHAASFELIYDKTKKETSVAIFLIGAAESRWLYTAERFEILHLLKKVKLEKAYNLTPQEFGARFEISSEENLSVILKEFYNSCKRSTDFNSQRFTQEESKEKNEALNTALLSDLSAKLTPRFFLEVYEKNIKNASIEDHINSLNSIKDFSLIAKKLIEMTQSSNLDAKIINYQLFKIIIEIITFLLKNFPENHVLISKIFNTYVFFEKHLPFGNDFKEKLKIITLFREPTIYQMLSEEQKPILLNLISSLSVIDENDLRAKFSYLKDDFEEIIRFAFTSEYKNFCANKLQLLSHLYVCYKAEGKEEKGTEITQELLKYIQANDVHNIDSCDLGFLEVVAKSELNSVILRQIFSSEMITDKYLKYLFISDNASFEQVSELFIKISKTENLEQLFELFNFFINNPKFVQHADFSDQIKNFSISLTHQIKKELEAYQVQCEKKFTTFLKKIQETSSLGKEQLFDKSFLTAIFSNPFPSEIITYLLLNSSIQEWVLKPDNLKIGLKLLSQFEVNPARFSEENYIRELSNAFAVFEKLHLNENQRLLLDLRADKFIETAFSNLEFLKTGIKFYSETLRASLERNFEKLHLERLFEENEDTIGFFYWFQIDKTFLRPLLISIVLDKLKDNTLGAFEKENLSKLLIKLVHISAYTTILFNQFDTVQAFEHFLSFLKENVHVLDPYTDSQNVSNLLQHYLEESSFLEQVNETVLVESMHVFLNHLIKNLSTDSALYQFKELPQLYFSKISTHHLLNVHLEASSDIHVEALIKLPLYLEISKRLSSIKLNVENILKLSKHFMEAFTLLNKIKASLSVIEKTNYGYQKEMQTLYNSLNEALFPHVRFFKALRNQFPDLWGFIPETI